MNNFNAMYRIHTERKQEELVIEECRNMLASFSILYGVGCYQGTVEDSMVIEVLLEYSTHNTGLIRCLAESIKAINKQDVVLVTVTNLASEEL